MSKPLLSLLFVFLGQILLAQNNAYGPTQTIPSPSLHGYMGASLASEGNYMASSEPLGGVGKGVVFFYELQSGKWVLKQSLSSPRTDGPSRFGTSLDMDGVQVIIGDNEFDGNDPYLGSAYIVERQANGKYQIQAKLQHPNKLFGTNFGECVGISQDWAAVGANYGEKGKNSGEVLIYRKEASDWKFAQRIQHLPDSAHFTWFGSQVAMEGEFLVVSASYEKVHDKKKAGAVYLYKREQGQYKLLHRFYVDIKQGVAGQEFGRNICLKDGLLTISHTAKHGAVYLYDLHRAKALSDYSPLMIIRQPDGIPSENAPYYAYGFGNMVSVDQNYLVIGADNTTDKHFSAYVYKRNRYGLFDYDRYLLFPTKRNYDGYFDAKLTTTGPWVFISDPEDDLQHLDASYADKSKGIVYAFKITGYERTESFEYDSWVEDETKQGWKRKPVNEFPYSQVDRLASADYFVLDYKNGDGVFILRNKKTKKWGMYQALGSDWRTLIPQAYDSIEFFGFNAAYTFVYNDDLMALYPSPWDDDNAPGTLPCQYSAVKKYGRNVAMKRGRFWHWIDVRSGKEIAGIQALRFEDLPLPAEK